MPNAKSTAFSNLRFLSRPDPFDPIGGSDSLELDESDVVWSTEASPKPRTDNSPPRNHRPQQRHSHRRFYPSNSGLTAALTEGRNAPPAARFEPRSAPLNIPAWSKELTSMDKGRRRFGDVPEEDDDEGADVAGEMIPPHVIVARSHVTFSVFEGAGRTLKGRDLRRVRNAVFQKTGFID